MTVSVDVSEGAYEALRDMPIDLEGLDLAAFPSERVDATIGNAASWAVWAPKPDSTTTGWSRDLSAVRDYDSLRDVIHGRVVFLALNKGTLSTGDTEPAWANFHSGSRDYMLAEAICASPVTRGALWGAYMTDFYKGLPTRDGAELKAALQRMAPEEAQRLTERMVSILHREFEILGNPSPTLICVGAQAYELASKHLSELRSIPITHYGASISKAAYAAELLQVAESISS